VLTDCQVLRFLKGWVLTRMMEGRRPIYQGGFYMDATSLRSTGLKGGYCLAISNMGLSIISYKPNENSTPVIVPGCYHKMFEADENLHIHEIFYGIYLFIVVYSRQNYRSVITEMTSSELDTLFPGCNDSWKYRRYVYVTCYSFNDITRMTRGLKDRQVP
jgi:hypothetical protein